MKHIIQNYYSDVPVDTDRIMQKLGFTWKKIFWRDRVVLMSAISAMAMLCSFLYFAVTLNIDYFSTALSIYGAFWGVTFALLSVMTSLVVFLIQFHVIILMCVVLLLLSQIWVVRAGYCQGV